MTDQTFPKPDTNEKSRWPDLLEQDEIWIDGAGITHSLDDMEPRYCGNVYAMLLRWSGSYFDYLYSSMLTGPFPEGDMACDAFDSGMDELLDAQQNPEEHIKQYPLLIALQRRMNGEPAQPPETPTERIDLMETVDQQDTDIARAPGDVDALLAEVGRLRAEVEGLHRCVNEQMEIIQEAAIGYAERGDELRSLRADLAARPTRAEALRQEAAWLREIATPIHGRERTEHERGQMYAAGRLDERADAADIRQGETGSAR